MLCVTPNKQMQMPLSTSEVINLCLKNKKLNKFDSILNVYNKTKQK